MSIHPKVAVDIEIRRSTRIYSIFGLSKTYIPVLRHLRTDSISNILLISPKSKLVELIFQSRKRIKIFQQEGSSSPHLLEPTSSDVPVRLRPYQTVLSLHGMGYCPRLKVCTPPAFKARTGTPFTISTWCRAVTRCGRHTPSAKSKLECDATWPKS